MEMSFQHLQSLHANMLGAPHDNVNQQLIEQQLRQEQVELQQHLGVGRLDFQQQQQQQQQLVQQQQHVGHIIGPQGQHPQMQHHSYHLPSINSSSHLGQLSAHLLLGGVPVPLIQPKPNPTPADLAQRKWSKLMDDSSTVIWLDRSDDALEIYRARKTLRCLLCPAVFIAYPDTGNINKHCRTELHKRRVDSFLSSQGLNSSDNSNYAGSSGSEIVGGIVPPNSTNIASSSSKASAKKRKAAYINQNPVGDIYLSGPPGTSLGLGENSSSVAVQGMDDLVGVTKVRRSQEELTTRKWNRLLADPSTALWLDQSSEALETYRSVKTLHCLICPAQFIAYPDTGNINKHCKTDLHKRRADTLNQKDVLIVDESAQGGEAPHQLESGDVQLQLDGDHVQVQESQLHVEVTPLQTDEQVVVGEHLPMNALPDVGDTQVNVHNSCNDDYGDHRDHLVVDVQQPEVIGDQSMH